MNMREKLGVAEQGQAAVDPKLLIEYINLKLEALGLPIYGEEGDFRFISLTKSLISSYQEQSRLLSYYLCPADQRIQSFLHAYLEGVAPAVPVRLPGRTFVLDRHGLARTLSLPPDQPEYASDIIRSYRCVNGVLHNPVNDRRTTKGVFHVAEDGLPVPDDKKAVPRLALAHLLHHALNPPADLLRLPFTASMKQPAETFVSLLLRPVICPEVPGFMPEKNMEIRFFAPGSMVANLDFVESIFGNGGDPYLPAHNAALDADHWSGFTGCVILAPHLTRLTKKEVGLPHQSQATERQQRDGMCWTNEDERYNDGSAFKVTVRDHRGVMVTVIADNYFGYCKKEVKTQISYAANLYGVAEEEHAGGAVVFPRYDLGEDFLMGSAVPSNGQTLDEMCALFPEAMVRQPEGHAVDRTYPDIIYVPETVQIDLDHQAVSWPHADGTHRIKLLPDHTYVLPSGYKIEMLKPARGSRWRLIGEVPEGTVCHKPCTVSGGGKSEISKPIADAMIDGPVFIGDFKHDFDLVESIIHRDYKTRYRVPKPADYISRPLLSDKRTLGSVIKLLTPSADYNNAYNQWLNTIPQYVKDLVFVVKRYYKPDWGEDWRSRFSVDTVNGKPGNELRYRNRKINTRYVRIGYAQDGSWRIFGVRKDFIPSFKLSAEDDISASITVPTRILKNLDPAFPRPSAKLVQNCEFRFFQRPDDAIVRGYDHKTEADMSRDGNFFCNYEPLTREQAREIMEETIRFSQFTEPVQKLFRDFLASDTPGRLISPAHPRLVDGKPTKNPRYLQNRPDLENPRAWYLTEMAARLYRRAPLGQPMARPVNAVLPGRRNNPPDAGVRPLCCYNPIHYMPLPELFMEFIASITGKSPSTTGAGSEGALTKGPFNALLPIHDLNSMLVSMLACDDHAFITAAGYVGPHYRVDHDVSLLIPELWSRMKETERTPADLLAKGCLERCADFQHEGRLIPASRLGYRITAKFMQIYGGRMFSDPDQVFTEDMLKPEKQDFPAYVDSIENIAEAHRWVAEHYFHDGSLERALPPLKALLHIMARGQFEGKGLDHPEVRALFTRESMMASDWYRARLAARRDRGVAHQQFMIQEMETFLKLAEYKSVAERMDIEARLTRARERLAFVQTPEYLNLLEGTIGADPSLTAMMLQTQA